MVRVHQPPRVAEGLDVVCVYCHVRTDHGFYMVSDFQCVKKCLQEHVTFWNSRDLDVNVAFV